MVPFNSMSFNLLNLPWVNEIRYGIYIVKSRSFKCSFDHAKRALYRSLNTVFGHYGRSASVEVVINVVTHIFLYCYIPPKSVQYLDRILILLILLLIDS